MENEVSLRRRRETSENEERIRGIKGDFGGKERIRKRFL